MPSYDYFLYFRDGNPPIYEFEPYDEGGMATELFQNPALGDWCCNLRVLPSSTRIFIYKITEDSPDGAWIGFWLEDTSQIPIPQFVKDGLAMAFLLP